MVFGHLAVGAACAAGAFAAPAVSAAPAAAVLPVTSQPQLNSILGGLRNATQPEFDAGFASLLHAIVPAPRPSSTKEAAARISSIYAAKPKDIFGQAADFLLHGIASLDDFDLLNAYGKCNSFNNTNAIEPKETIYPKKSLEDAPYDLSEEELRSAIYFPPGFTFGKKLPVLMLPGTGVLACENFYGNYGKVFNETDYADPVYVNIPGSMLDDLQTASEYVAYATNYVSSISNRNVSAMTWSAGAITSHWAAKYWPSTRSVLSNIINVSGDYHATTLAVLVCPPDFPCPPSIRQQIANSTFIRTLLANGGESAYIPSTSIWTVYDEIVEPQQGEGASAHIGDANGVAVFNGQMQTICGYVSVAGSPNFGHEALLYNAVGYQLARDALVNDGPAQLDRSNATAYCDQFEAPGLDLISVLSTESVIPIATLNVILYGPKVINEPPIKAYAMKDMPASAA